MSKIAINICFTYKAALEKFAAIPENISSDLEYSKFQKKVKRLENILLQPTRYYKYQQLVFSLFESAPPPPPYAPPCIDSNLPPHEILKSSQFHVLNTCGKAEEITHFPQAMFFSKIYPPSRKGVLWAYISTNCKPVNRRKI